MRTPGTFSQSTHRGCSSRQSRAKWKARELRVPLPSAMPFLFPATETSWHGVPPARTPRRPASSMTSVPFVILHFSSPTISAVIFVMSPRFGTSGYLCASSEHGNGSTSEKKTGLHPPSGVTAALMHSIPLHTVAYVSSFGSVGICASFSAVEKFLREERKSALQPCSFPRPAFEGALGRNRGPAGHIVPPARGGSTSAAQGLIFLSFGR